MVSSVAYRSESIQSGEYEVILPRGSKLVIENIVPDVSFEGKEYRSERTIRRKLTVIQLTDITLN